MNFIQNEEAPVSVTPEFIALIKATLISHSSQTTSVALAYPRHRSGILLGIKPLLLAGECVLEFVSKNMMETRSVGSQYGSTLNPPRLATSLQLL